MSRLASRALAVAAALLVLAVAGFLLLRRSPPPAPPTPAVSSLPDAALPPLQLAFSGYEQVRLALASDDFSQVAAPAQALAAALAEAQAPLTGTPGTLTLLQGARTAADHLGAAKDLATARTAFGELSRAMLPLSGADPRIAQGWSTFQCPMATGFDRWMQPDDQMANPYMGTRMLKCGTAVTAEPAPPAHDPDSIAYHTCPMHPSVRSADPGVCPICGMDLIPVTQGSLQSGEVVVDEGRRQRIGVRVEQVTRAPLNVSIRAVGTVKYDETQLQDVSLKVGGWVRQLRVNATGEAVRKGQVLFTLYSPELLTAQQELLGSLRAPGVGDHMAHLARRRLRLWDIAEADIDAVVKKGQASDALPIRSPVSGFVLEKDVVEGAAVQPGMRTYRLASMDPMWLEAQIFESDLRHVKVGHPVEVTLPALPGQTLQSKVSFISPSLDSATRAALVRVVLPNPQGALRAEMYAELTLQLERGEALQIPASAVIYTGPRRLVFVDLGEGRLAPREVKLGVRAKDRWEVLEGLTEGERVVTAGNFLIAAESRLRSAADYWGGTQGQEGTGHVGH
ncbi:MAG: efflux RND transporter periplasmic adaptor subunit [Myxococcota bacterium]|nr:efflux RND transporter periplasmic adaptor subunit [Myxococcota bacterium]